MKILFPLTIMALSVMIIMNTGITYAQFGGPVMRPSVSISDVISSTNNVYVSWNGMVPNTNSPAAFLKASNDNGTNFGKTINLTQYGVPQSNLPMSNMKMTSSGNNLYLAWTDWTNNSVDSNIFFMKSSDGGQQGSYQMMILSRQYSI